MAKNTTLTHLSFGWNSMGDEGFDAFALALAGEEGASLSLLTLDLEYKSLSRKTAAHLGNILMYIPPPPLLLQ
jgi:hypothetical protein